jgi:hypothetical protein
MKYLLMTSFSIVMLFGVCFAGEKLELKDENEKVSYSLGFPQVEFPTKTIQTSCYVDFKLCL